ncbi:MULTISPECIES: type II toxin-antitoxin system HicA family toxin [Chroococcidiopsis]|jgi:predicted RNA binding protein YcfA (HicA-like mRNA interferase family)|uniref:YcfA family protein n=1 Tax=Chroococcidiopsis thermalis (strain PCC 7203) TaxID=251229 RepID=K9U8G9_CHRTP|nr:MULTISPECIES: type II toxin-antitoxin system HicA family toxin [Chroococcidiopsis]AFY91135.1 YcfA family protein [Chroococcidiopsis thermalis PCC 7203]PSM48208.1 type II toxin-antitoxin system HicA family toxin [Chroococcidiopsis sp. CCALA 051]
MSQLPSLTGREVIAALSKIGFEIARVRGSHHILLHSDGRRTVVPVHSGETIGRGLLAQILRDCQITRDEFKSLL